MARAFCLIHMLEYYRAGIVQTSAAVEVVLLHCQNTSVSRGKSMRDCGGIPELDLLADVTLDVA
jgi:hypothetical protein